MRGNSSARDDKEFDAILRGGRFEPFFQPIRETGNLEVIGYEALVRGPSGSRYRSAGALLAQAYRTGRIVEFDWAARVSACRAAMAAGIRPGRLLFLNIEPLALKSDTPPDFAADIAAAFETYQIVLEITERSLARDPKSLLEGIAYQRPKVAGLALDDLGTHGAAVPMLPLLSVDVIKLDQAVTHAGASSEATKTIDIALEEAERTGATLLSEGIENLDHIEFAREIGADLGQGHFLGEPAPLRHEWEDDARSWSLTTQPVPSVETPYDALQGQTTRRAREDLVRALSRQMGDDNVRLSAPALALTLVPEPDLFTDNDRAYLADMATRGVVTAALGPGLANPPADGVRGGPIKEPLLDRQWAVLTLSAETAAAMIGRRSPDAAHTYDYAITHNRHKVIMAARSIIAHVGL